MWYRRFISWLRSLFVVPESPASYPAPATRTPTLPMTAPLREPVSNWDSAPPPKIEFPARREPPTTVPLARLAKPSQPLTGLPASGDGLSAFQLLWADRDPAPPSQPPQAPIQPPPLLPEPRPEPTDTGVPQAGVEPLGIDFESVDDFGGEDPGEDDDVVPGSMLYRRLMILRRLVRQGVYNEGFGPDDTPEQYQRHKDADDFGNPFYGE
ncbi:MAG TPA: hypothetical protein VF808_14165 [Ktedonobacterales bacterium]